MSSPRGLLLIYLITMLGSSLTTVGSFISIHAALESAFSLSLALALRTLSFMVFTYLTPSLLNRFGEKATLVFAQFFGIIALGLLFYGFSGRVPALIYLGVILTGFPSNVTATGLVASLRMQLPDPAEFRRFSAGREMIAGLTLTLAGLAAPLGVARFGLPALLAFDAATYVVATLLLAMRAFMPHVRDVERPPFPGARQLCNPSSRALFVGVTPALLLMAVIPLVGSSAEFRAQVGLEHLLFQGLWAIEGIVAIVGGAFYLRARHRKGWISLMRLNALLLLAVALPLPIALKVAALFLIPLCYSVVYFEERDNLILKAGSDRHAVNVYAAVGNLARSFHGTLSPFVITLGFERLGPTYLAVGLLAVQAAFATARSRCEP